MAFDCELKELTAGPALSIRTRAAVQDLPEVFGKGFGAILEYLGKQNAAPAGPPFAVYYNMDLQNLDVELGFPVANALDGADAIQASQTPAGKAVVCLYVGPYEEVEPAYRALVKWIKRQGHEPAGVAYEVYLNDPENTPAAELQTQIHLLLKS
jgi:effector-binding domain-containing protein